MLALACQLGKWLREFTVRIEIYGKSLLFFFVQTVLTTVCHECDLIACALFPCHSDFMFCFYTKSPLKHFVVSQNALLKKVGNLSVT